MPSAIDLLAGSPAFRSSDSPQAILDGDFRFRGVNAAFEGVSGYSSSDLLGERMFDLFPHTPDQPGADGVARLTTSLELVLRRGKPQRMPIQRYDLPGRNSVHQFVRKVWAVTNRPVRDARGRPIAVLNQAEDLTQLLPPAKSAHGTASAAVRALLHEHEASVLLRRQADTLGEALESSRFIGIALGLVMAEHGLSREAVFDYLVASSQKQHRKLRKVANSLMRDCEARVVE